MVISQEYAAIEATRELLAKCEMSSIRLRRCNATLQGEEEKLTAPIKLAFSHSASSPGLIDGILRIEADFRFQGFDSSEGKSPLFSLDCSFDIDYEIKEGFAPPPEAIEAFKEGNAIFNCWPYARELVQNLTSKMCLSPPPLPLLRMIPKPKPKPSTSAPKE